MISLYWWFSKLSVHWNHLEACYNPQIAGPNSQSFRSSRTGWDQEFAFLLSSQVMLILLVWGPLFVESPVLQRSHLETPTACVYMRGVPKPARLTPKENSRKGWGFLLFLQGVVIKFYCWFWEQFMLKLASGRKKRNHNSGLKWRHLGFYCVSAPSVPLFTSQWGPAATGAETRWLFGVCDQFTGKMAFFRAHPPILVLWLLTRSEFLCLSPTCSVDRQWPWGVGGRAGGTCQDALRCREWKGCRNGRLSWMDWDRWHPCEILPSPPLLIHYHALLVSFSSMEEHRLHLPFLSSPFRWGEQLWKSCLHGWDGSLSTPDLPGQIPAKSGGHICPIIREHETSSATSLLFLFFFFHTRLLCQWIANSFVYDTPTPGPSQTPPLLPGLAERSQNPQS